MRYVAAYLLATLGGNANPKAADIKAILNSVGVDVETENLDRVIKQLSGKKLEALMAEGMEKLATMPSGGAGAGSAPAAGGAEEKKEDKAAKKEESEEEESDEDMGFGLFD